MLETHQSVVKCDTSLTNSKNARWRHQLETCSALLAICAGNSPVTGEFPTQRLVTRSFDVFFDLRLNKPLSKQWWDRWIETHGAHYDVFVMDRGANTEPCDTPL